MWTYTNTYELYHHGILGQKWGVRRFQDKKGRLTSAGKQKYSDDSRKKKDDETNSGKKKYIKIGDAAAATALVAYGGYKLYKDRNIIQMKARLGKDNLQFIKDHDIGHLSSTPYFGEGGSKHLNHAESLYHHGILGQRWGIRRFQDKKGRLTSAGKKRYSYNNDQNKKDDEAESNKKFKLTDNQKKYIKIGATVAATALVAYGGYKLYQSGKLDSFIDKGKNTIEQDSIQELSADVKSAMESIKNDKFAPGIFDSSQVSKLTDSEVKSIRAYTTPLYKEANAVLRGDGEGTIAGKTIAKDVTEALKKVTLSSDVKVQRGINQSTARKILGQDVLNELQKIKNQSGDNSGEIILDSLKGIKNKDNGIMSTAVPYVNPRGKEMSICDYFSGKDGIIFDINASSGTHGMYISPLSENAAEREVIFSPGSSIALTGAVKIVDGIIHVGAKIMQ